MNRRAHGNLGEEPNSFIGRERELDEMRKLAASARALTLCGAGGIGKTRLAVRVLAELADDFPDGVWFVELADLRQPDLVVSRISSVIGVAEEPGRPLLDTLADALRPRRVLLGLDNCEQLIEACARVCQRLLASAPGLRVIATSREPLRVAAETVWQVPPLSLPAAEDTSDAAVYLEEPAGSDAIRLFEDRAAAAMPGFVLTPANMASAVQICRALDGLPLAIELAATWVRVLSVEQIAARLDDRFQLLTSGDRTAPPRQRTLRAAIDWSHDLLTPAEQVMLRRLSVFAGWTLEMAERVCADDTLPAGEILDLLSALTDKSLVMVEAEALSQTRYRMLDTIRGYAASRLAEAGETARLHNRLRDYTVAVAERSMVVGMALVRAPWSARVDVFRRFDVDADNMGQVLSRCLADRDAETGLRICTAVRPCWIVRGLFAEGSEWLDMFLALDVPDMPDAVRGRALVGRAQLVLASDPVRAEADAMAGLELCWAAGEEFWTAGALNVLTETALHAGKIDVAHGGQERRRPVERGVCARHPRGRRRGARRHARGPGARRGRAGDHGGHRPAVGRGQDAARPGRPGPDDRRRGHRPGEIPGRPGHLARGQRPPGDRTVPGGPRPDRDGAEGHGARPPAADREPGAQCLHRQPDRRHPGTGRVRCARDPGRPARPRRAAGRGGRGAARRGGPAGRPRRPDAARARRGR
jgi:predicted ATPase